MRGGAAHTLIKEPMHAVPPMHARGRGFCKMRGLAAGLGVMLVDEGGADRVHTDCQIDLFSVYRTAHYQ